MLCTNCGIKFDSDLTFCVQCGTSRKPASPQISTPEFENEESLQSMPKYSIPRHIWRAIYPLIVWWMLFLVVGFIFLVISVFGVAIGLTHLDYDQELIFLGLVPVATFAVIIVFFALMWRFTRKKLPKYKNNKLGPLNVTLTILICGGLSYLIIAIFSLIDGYIGYIFYGLVYYFLFENSFMIQVLFAVILRPIADELLFRGILFNRLSAWTPTWVAILISSVLYGVMQIIPILGLFSALLGAVLCVLYVRYRNLWIPIIGHMTFGLVNLVTSEIRDIVEIEINDFVILGLSLAVVAGCVLVMKIFSRPANTDLELNTQPQKLQQPELSLASSQSTSHEISLSQSVQQSVEGDKEVKVWKSIGALILMFALFVGAIITFLVIIGVIVVAVMAFA